MRLVASSGLGQWGWPERVLVRCPCGQAHPCCCQGLWLCLECQLHSPDCFLKDPNFRFLRVIKEPS